MIVLENETLKLEPFKTLADFDYLYKIAKRYKFNNLTVAEMEKDILDFGKHFWSVYVKIDKYNKTKIGVAFTQYVPAWDWWTIDAFRDEPKSKEFLIKPQIIFDAAELVMKYMFENHTKVLRIVHDIQDRQILLVAKRLGFKREIATQTKYGTYLIHKKEVDCYGLGRASSKCNRDNRRVDIRING